MSTQLQNNEHPREPDAMKVRTTAAEALAMCGNHKLEVVLQLVETLKDPNDLHAAIDAARVLVKNALAH